MSQKVVVKWDRDLKVESNLKLLGIKFEQGICKIEDIDLKDSLLRQARMEAKLDMDRVLSYAIMMEAGAAFPKSIINRYGKSCVVVGGNHRIAAALQHSVTEIECYFVSITDATMFDMLPRLTNIWEGAKLSKEEALNTAEHAMTMHSLSAKDAAKLCGVQVKHLLTHSRTNDVRRELESNGVHVGDVSNTLLLNMASIASVNVRRAVGALIRRDQLGFVEKRTMIEDVKRVQDKGEAHALIEVDRWRAEVDKRANKRPNRSFAAPIRERFLSQLQGLSKTLVDFGPSVSRLQLTDDDLARVEEMFSSVLTSASSLSKEILKRKKTGATS